jgi:hypothetical protein
VKYRRLIDGEPQFGQGQQNFLQGIDAVAQAIQTSLSLFTGEWWEDLNDGLPLWIGLLGYEGSNKEKSNAIIVKRILEINLDNKKLVSSVNNVINTYNSTLRKYTFEGTAISIYGAVTISNGG